MLQQMRTTICVFAVTFAAVALPGVALAVDGQVAINQARAMAGGVTPADTAGFPITISVPGSYVLTSNLAVPRGLDGIVIAANDVLLDLNGFTIQGGALSFADDGKGIHAPLSGIEYTGLTIRNGTIAGFSDGIFLLRCRSYREARY